MIDILLIGYGTIGQDLVRLLEPELTRGDARILAAAVRDPERRRSPAPRFPIIPARELPATISSASLVVECAGVAAAIDLGPAVIRAGVDLVLTSVGALANEDARLGMLSGPGALTVTNGAIGGLDVLAAAAQADGLDEVSIETAKLASSLERPWMTEAEREHLRTLTAKEGPFVVYEGNAAAAIDKFPANVNVAVALAWATRTRLALDASPSDRSDALARSLERVQVRILADPAARLSRHLIRASGSSGTYEFALENAPSPSNPRTSGLTAMSVARNVRDFISRHNENSRLRNERIPGSVGPNAKFPGCGFE